MFEGIDNYINAGDPAFGGDLQRAVDAAEQDWRPGKGGGVFLPPGITFYVSDPPLVLTRWTSIWDGRPGVRDHVELCGGGPSSRVVFCGDSTRWADPHSGAQVQRALIEFRTYPLPGPDPPLYLKRTRWPILRDFTIDGGGDPNIVGLRLHGALAGRVRNLAITNCGAAAISLEVECHGTVLDGVVIEDCGTGIRLPQLLPWDQLCQDLLIYDPGDPGQESSTVLRHGVACSAEKPDEPDDVPIPPEYWVFAEDEGLTSVPTPYESPEEFDSFRQPGVQSSNGVWIVNSVIRRIDGVGIRVNTSTCTFVQNTCIEDCGEAGVHLAYAQPAMIQGCSFARNGFPAGVVGPLEGAQVVLGRKQPFAPEPAAALLGKPHRCIGVQILGCSFDGRRGSGEESGPVGVLLDDAVGTMIAGCRFEGHGAYPIYATDNSRGTTILGNSFEPGAVMFGPEEAVNHDARLGAVDVISFPV